MSFLFVLGSVLQSELLNVFVAFLRSFVARQNITERKKNEGNLFQRICYLENCTIHVLHSWRDKISSHSAKTPGNSLRDIFKLSQQRIGSLNKFFRIFFLIFHIPLSSCCWAKTLAVANRISLEKVIFGSVLFLRVKALWTIISHLFCVSGVFWLFPTIRRGIVCTKKYQILFRHPESVVREDR